MLTALLALAIISSFKPSSCTMNMNISDCPPPLAEMKKPPEVYSELLTDFIFSQVNRHTYKLENSEPPKTVNVSILIQSIGPFEESNMVYQIDMAYREYWQDLSLHSDNIVKHGKDNYNIMLEPVAIGSTEATGAYLWRPDICFPNSEPMRSKTGDMMRDNVAMQLLPNGNMFLKTRLTLVLKCPVSYVYYPFDKPVCALRVETFGTTSEHVLLKWKNGNDAIEIVPNIQLAQFKLLHHKAIEGFVISTTGNYSALEVRFTFHRDIMYFILSVFMPACLITILSWINFFISPSAVPARASLAITSFLSAITFYQVAKYDGLPRVSEVKAQDIFLLICLMYNFAALIEFTLVEYFENPFIISNKSDAFYADNNGENGKKLIHGPSDHSNDKLRNRYHQKALCVDHYARIFFPVTFVIVVIVYIVVYSVATKFTDSEFIQCGQPILNAYGVPIK